MLSPERPDRIHVAFDDPRLVANAGMLLPVTLAQRLGLSQLADSHLDLGDAPGRANAGDKILTLVASALAGGDCINDADALRAGGTRASAGVCGQGAIHPGDIPAQLPVGPRAPAGPGEPGTAGACLGRRGRPRRLASDDRPGLHRLRDLRSGQGGSAPSQLHRPARLSSAAGRCRGNRRRADGAAASGAGQHRPGRRTLPA